MALSPDQIRQFQRNAKLQGFTDQEIQDSIARKSMQMQAAPQPTTQIPSTTGGLGGPGDGKKNSWADWIPLVASIGGGALLSPLGPAGIVGGSAAGGGIGSFLKQAFQNDPGDIHGGEIAKEAALSGASALPGLALSKGLSLLKGGSKAAASAVEGSIINPKVATGPAAYAEEQALIKTGKNMGLTGAAQDMRSQSADMYKGFKDQVASILKGNKTPVDVSSAHAAIQTGFDEGGYLAGEKTYDAAAKKILTLVDKRGTNVSSLQDVFDLSNEIDQKFIGKAYDTINKGGTITPLQETAIAAKQGLDKYIRGIAPELEGPMSQMSNLHKLAPGLEKSASGGGISLPVVGKVPGSNAVIQGGASKFAGAANAVANKTPTIPYGLSGAASELLTRPLVSGAQSAAGDSGAPSDVPDQATMNQPDSTQQDQPMMDERQLQLAVMTDLAKTGGKNVDKIQKVYTLLNPKGANASKPRGVQAVQMENLAKSGLREVERVESIFKKDPNVAAKQLLPGKWLSRDFDASAYRAVESLLRARSGAAVPEQEVRRYMTSYMPTFGDDPTTAQSKLNSLKQALVDMLTGSQSVGQTTPDNQAGGTAYGL